MKHCYHYRLCFFILSIIAPIAIATIHLQNAFIHHHHGANIIFYPKKSFSTSFSYPIINIGRTFFAQSNDNNDQHLKGDDENVEVGSKEYYSGFVSRNLNQEPEQRVTGDAILVPTLKFVGGFAVILAFLLVGFLASNGLF